MGRNLDSSEQGGVQALSGPQRPDHPSPTAGDTALSRFSWATGVGGDSLRTWEKLEKPQDKATGYFVLSVLLSHPPAAGRTPALAIKGAAFLGETEAQDGTAVGSSGPSSGPGADLHRCWRRTQVTAGD